MIPPVLLTVTQEQFIAATRGKDKTRPSRCDPYEDARESRLLIAGDEHVGVSSALMWIGAQKCLADSQLIPIVIDYIAMGSSGTNPLRRQVIKELRKTGQWLREDDDLPPVVLIIDNMHLGARPRLERVISELCSGSYAHILIGCRVGVEGKLYEEVSEACGKFERRYVGRLARGDVRALARLVDAPREESLADKAIEVVRAHSLPSTPFTYSMILSAILRGESLMAATSPTALLDAYVDLLLGRGGISEDSRFGLDAINRGYILGELAELFVRRQVGALPQMQVVGRLEESFETLDWPEVPVDIIKDLQLRHILVLRGGSVSFTQSSYLHLFAAKRALESPEFLDHLVADALYYAPILAHYAALKRSDVKLLARLMSLIDPFLDETVMRSSAFREADVAVKTDSSVEEIGRRIDRETALATRDRSNEDDFTPLDAMEDDLVPFPLTPIDDQPLIARMVTVLGLRSNILRDTEIFPDHELRKHALRRILDGWAQFADRIEAEENFGPMVQQATEYLAYELKLSPKRIKRMAEDIATILPLSMAIGGISATLSTRKLSRTVERCFDDEEFCTDPALALLGAYMLCDVQTVGWSRPLPMIYESHRKILGIRTLFRSVLMFTYFRTPMESQDERTLQEFLTEQLIDDEMPRSKKERSALKGQVIEKLKRAKLIWKDAKLPAGQSPMLSAGTAEDSES